MSQSESANGCRSAAHFNRRTLIKTAGALAAAWMTPLAEALARQAEKAPRGAPAKSVIMLWLQGGPSQLETFDPHPNAKIAAGTKAIPTRVKGIQLAAGLNRIADQMEHLSIVRSTVSKEGDHERATYNAKTGFRPDPTLVHPAIGAVASYQLNDNVEIPRHVSILPGPFPARGGYLGDRYDAFKVGDPANPIPDVKPRVTKARQDQRIKDLQVVEKQFARRRLRGLDLGKTLHRESTSGALRMMTSDQLAAFDVKKSPQALREEFGDTRFGRGCLAALRLIEVGVRCVEVTLSGWDTHTNNHESHATLVKTLDPAFAALVRQLHLRDLLKHTIVVCGGEFGRTPEINPLDGRDHWPHGFSVVMGGGGIRGGTVYGGTAPEPKLDPKNRMQDIDKPRNIADIHATILGQLGVAFEEEFPTPIGRPMAVSQGKVIKELVT